MSTLVDAMLTLKRANGHIAYYSRSDVLDREKVATSRRDAEAARIEIAIHNALATAPPLSTEQRERLAALLAGGAK